MKKALILSFLAATVAACSSDPQAAADRRQAYIQSIFPNPADQTGLHLVFPIESGGFNSILEIIYFPEVVSEGTVMQRTANYCSKHRDEAKAYVRTPTADTTANQADGTQRNAKRIVVSCYPNN